MSQQPYYVPESSKLPFAMAITMLVFIIGAANTVIDLGKDTNSYLILVASMLMLWVTMYFWFKQVIQEGVYEVYSRHFSLQVDLVVVRLM